MVFTSLIMSLEEEDRPTDRPLQGRFEPDASFPSHIEKLPKLDMFISAHKLATHQHEGPTLEDEAEQTMSSEGTALLHDSLPPGHNLSVPMPGNRIRRKSAPSMLEPIQEGLLGNSNRRNSGLLAQTSFDRKEKFNQMVDISESPLGLKHSRFSERRRSDPIGLYHHYHHSDDKLKLFSYEGRFPPPKRNSLVSATLDELTSQFELLDRRKRVVEEAEVSAEPEASVKLPPILITDS